MRSLRLVKAGRSLIGRVAQDRPDDRSFPANPRRFTGSRGGCDPRMQRSRKWRVPPGGADTRRMASVYPHESRCRPPLLLEDARRLRPARAQGPKVRRLPAGGKWIRTFGTATQKPAISEAFRGSRAASTWADVVKTFQFTDFRE